MCRVSRNLEFERFLEYSVQIKNSWNYLLFLHVIIFKHFRILYNRQNYSIKFSQMLKMNKITRSTKPVMLSFNTEVRICSKCLQHFYYITSIFLMHIYSKSISYWKLSYILGWWENCESGGDCFHDQFTDRCSNFICNRVSYRIIYL